MTRSLPRIKPVDRTAIVGSPSDSPDDVIPLCRVFVDDVMIERARAWENKQAGPQYPTHLPEWWRDALKAALEDHDD